jgi:hypothetical protein
MDMALVADLNLVKQWRPRLDCFRSLVVLVLVAFFETQLGLREPIADDRLDAAFPVLFPSQGLYSTRLRQSTAAFGLQKPINFVSIHKEDYASIS